MNNIIGTFFIFFGTIKFKNKKQKKLYICIENNERKQMYIEPSVEDKVKKKQVEKIVNIYMISISVVSLTWGLRYHENVFSLNFILQNKFLKLEINILFHVKN